MGQKQAVNCGIATRRDLCVGRLTLGKHHTRTHMCVHAHMGTCPVRTYMRQTTVPRRVTVSQRLVKISAWEGSRGKTSYAYSHAYSYAYMRTCVRAYIRTYVRTHARKHVGTYACAHVLHIWVCVWFFFPARAFPRIGLRIAIPSRVAWVAVPQFTTCFYRLLLILFVCMSVRLTCAVTHVRTYEYAYWAFPAWTFPRIGLYESPPLYFKKWFKAFITATDSHSMAVRKSSLAPLLTSRVTALLQSK